jgi:hypothetical protein
MSGGSDAPPPPPVYQFQNQGGADQGAFQGIQDLANQPNYAQQAFNSFAPGLQGAGAASGWDPAATVAAGNAQSGVGNQLNSYGFQILNNGFDPQQELYSRTQQQLQDQVRAGQAARGISMTPYGAGLENQANSNFNLDWQDRALGRQATAAGAAAPLFQQGNTNVINGQQLGMSVPQLQSQLLQSLQTGALGNTTAQQQVIQDYLNYLSGGAQGDANAVARYKAEIESQKNQDANSNAMWGGIGKLAGNAAAFAFM